MAARVSKRMLQKIMPEQGYTQEEIDQLAKSQNPLWLRLVMNRYAKKSEARDREFIKSVAEVAKVEVEFRDESQVQNG